MHRGGGPVKPGAETRASVPLPRSPRTASTPQGTGGRDGSPTASAASAARPTPRLWACGLQKCERRHLRCSEPLSVWSVAAAALGTDVLKARPVATVYKQRIYVNSCISGVSRRRRRDHTGLASLMGTSKSGTPGPPLWPPLPAVSLPLLLCLLSPAARARGPSLQAGLGGG